MGFNLDFVYYRNFTFDGKFHVRCTGDDLHKVKSIQYLLEREVPEGVVQLDGVNVLSQVHSGTVANHGCPATLSCEVLAGTYRITPLVTLIDSEVIKQDLDADADATLREGPLLIEVSEGELTRRILDTVPLSSSGTRRRRAAQEGATLPPLPEGQRYPALILVFSEGGHARFMADVQADASSSLAHDWPGLQKIIDLQPFLEPHEREDEHLQVLANHYWVEQPQGMPNATFSALVQSLNGLEYVEDSALLPPQLEPGNLLAFAAAAVIATLLTGGAYAAGTNANEQAQPTPDFEALQRYLNEPDSSAKGLNIRNAWQAGVQGRGVRVHFSDGGLYANHEDLRGNPRLKVIPPTVDSEPDHGTASVGVLLAHDNGLGMTGICHAAELFLYDNRAYDARGYSQTLKKLLAYARAGDIVGVNRQTANVNVLGTFLPSLHDRTWWDVTRSLTERGVVVLNAACNGTSVSDHNARTTQGYGVDLEQWRYFDDHGEADAILVGACHSWDGKPHQYSNYNYRYRMLNGWGDSVATLGYGALQDKNGHDRDYTSTYGGTSSATPMVTGALALIQSYAIEQHHLYLNADQMHLLVMQSGYKDATLPDASRLPMGARPNVLGALVLLDQILQAGRFHLPDDGFCGDECAPQA
ncbi:Calcium-dependent protease precursor [compost metagenome]|uniref:S8 family serine peptidase n=1 Tax=Pseudomonas capeferrum TaxID=1495066 RepID=A0ABY7RFB7_9PSED|nr:MULTISPECIES: S8 family serine peptidase [Pseudomonas]KEY88124.1 peptidase S8 [Pseudomonas capeferrum]KGI91216.1 peptidase S8 [Pseudomonas sp. H2]MCH7299382.1 S8 family serine peptidase [Pseudomonas capeferrum]MUT52406.1 S8 family serine peptidase [Pseudomonas sp. TDA1]WCI02387.1 S8 family serine peptidase [Pseudomonas capeferrum]